MSKALQAAELAEHFLLYTHKNVFLTGKAGTGKTTFLHHITQTTLKKTLVTAPTGIAALNAKGVTLHSQFNLPFTPFLPIIGPMQMHENVHFETYSTLNRHFRMSPLKRKTIREAELLIIDEVSMLRADTLDAIDLSLRFVRKTKKAFGGLQVLFIGDMMQLPPVVKREEWMVMKNHYASPFFFDAKALENNMPVFIELEKIYRQSDPVFTDLLNKIRRNEARVDDYALLNKQYIPDLSKINTEGYIRLTTHNKEAAQINKEKLEELSEKEYTYKAKVSGEFPEHMYPCEKELILKKGAQVMFIKNDQSGQQLFFNGKIGTISHAEIDALRVQFPDGSEIDVPSFEWENIKYSIDDKTKAIKEEVVGTYEQIPLRLAWAITIHKSQGLTFEKAIIDIENVFAGGQSYVALSRLKSLEGLILSSPVRNNGIAYDPSLIKFEEKKYLQGDLYQILKNATADYAATFCADAFFLLPLLKAWKEHVDSYSEENAVPEKIKNLVWAKEILEKMAELENVSARFAVQLQQAFRKKEYVFIHSRIQAAISYFDQPFREIITAIYLESKSLRSKASTKAYIDELEEMDAYFTRSYLYFHRCIILLTAIIEDSDKAYALWQSTDFLAWKKELKAPEKRIKDSYAEEEYPKEKKKKAAKKVKGETYLITLDLWEKHRDINEIVKARNLALSTICGHLTKLAAEEKIPGDQLISSKEQQELTDFINKSEISSLGQLLKMENLPLEKWKIIIGWRLMSKGIVSE